MFRARYTHGERVDGGPQPQPARQTTLRPVAAFRLALAQVNPRVGDLEGNARIVVEWARRAADAGADLVAFPEMMLTGYPIEDLALRASFVEASREALRQLAAELDATGSASSRASSATSTRWPTQAERLGVPQGSPQNAAAVLHRGAVVASLRQAAPAQLRRLRRVPQLRARRRSLVVDAWPGSTSRWPSARTCGRTGPSPMPAQPARAAGGRLQRVAVRGEQGRHPAGAVRTPGGRGRCPLAYVNMVGGQDELVFDGDSIVVTPTARCWRAPPSSRTSSSSSTSTSRPPRAPMPTPRTPGPPTRASPGPPAASDRLELRVADRLGDEAGALHGDRDRAARLRPQERLPLRPARDVRGHRLHAGRPGRLRRARRPRTSTASPTPATTPASTPTTTRPSTRAARACTSAPCRSSRWSTRTRTSWDSRGSRRRTSRRGSARSSGWGCPTRRATWCWHAATRASSRVGYSTIYGDAVGGFAPIKDLWKTQVWAAGPLAQRRRGGARRAATDPRELHHEGAQRRAASRPARHRLAARLRRARRRPRRLRRAGPRLAPPGRRRVRPGARRAGAAAGRPRRVQAAAVPSRARSCRCATSAATGACRSPTPGAERVDPRPDAWQPHVTERTPRIPPLQG